MRGALVVLHMLRPKNQKKVLNRKYFRPIKNCFEETVDLKNIYNLAYNYLTKWDIEALHEKLNNPNLVQSFVEWRYIGWKANFFKNGTKTCTKTVKKWLEDQEKSSKRKTVSAPCFTDKENSPLPRTSQPPEAHTLNSSTF